MFSPLFLILNDFILKVHTGSVTVYNVHYGSAVLWDWDTLGIGATILLFS